MTGCLLGFASNAFCTVEDNGDSTEKILLSWFVIVIKNEFWLMMWRRDPNLYKVINKKNQTFEIILELNWD